ncbi:MAG TPA: hypothetical protein VKA43_16970 [Gammaproteobacteria bacterium]|nr:hypothetical protein [Gammaproteobacteria bacterium]
MPEQFEALRLELRNSGIAPVYVERTIAELTAHLADLESAARAAGFVGAEAERMARAQLGDDRAIAAAVLGRPELLAWSTRYPRVAYCLQSAATIGTLPGLPIVYCIEHRPGLARWGVSLGLAVTIVGSIMAALNALIVLV